MYCHVYSGLAPPLDLSTKIFDQDMGLPSLSLPPANNHIFHWEGEMQYQGTLYGMSPLPTMSIKEIEELTNGPKVFLSVRSEGSRAGPRRAG